MLTELHENNHNCATSGKRAFCMRSIALHVSLQTLANHMRALTIDHMRVANEAGVCTNLTKIGQQLNILPTSTLICFKKEDYSNSYHFATVNK